MTISCCWGLFFRPTWHYFIGNPCHINILLIFWVNLFKTQNKLISHGLGSYGPRDPYFKRQIHGPISFSSIEIITHDIINVNMWIDLKQQIKAHGPYYLSYTHGKWLLQQEPIFTQNNNETRGTSSHLWLMTQAHKSLWGNFKSRGLEGQEVCSVKLQRFKVDKKNMLLSVSSSTPWTLTSPCIVGNIW